MPTLVDRCELFNRHALVSWVAAAGCPRSRAATSTAAHLVRLEDGELRAAA